jgi:hypothetical protein
MESDNKPALTKGMRQVESSRYATILDSEGMADYVKAVFEHGSFVPETPCDLPEGAQVLLTIYPRATVAPPAVEAPEERARILRGIVDRMRRNPLPADAQRISRDDMHERG